MPAASPATAPTVANNNASASAVEVASKRISIHTRLMFSNVRLPYPTFDAILKPDHKLQIGREQLVCHRSEN